MAKNISLLGADYPDVPAVDLPKTGGGTARFVDGDEKKDLQTAVTDPTASGTAISFIDTISQDAQGVIAPTKKTVRTATQSQSGVMSSTDKTKLDGLKTIKEDTWSGTTNQYGFAIASVTTNRKIISAHSDQGPIVIWEYTGNWVFGLIQFMPSGLQIGANLNFTVTYTYYE